MCKPILTTPVRCVVAPVVFILSMLGSGQVSAFDFGGLQYNPLTATEAEVDGFAAVSSPTINIPDTVTNGAITYNVTSIADSAFANESTLTSVSIGDNVTSIGSSAFSETSALGSVTIGNSVATIGADAFGLTGALTSVVIPDSVVSIGASAFNASGLQSVIIPDSVTSIGASAFRDNDLDNVVIGASVATIGQSAFAGNSIASLIIPDSVTTIAADAFGNNVLTSVAFQGNFGVGTFDLNMFIGNVGTLSTITYCEEKTGWPRDFLVDMSPDIFVGATPDLLACPVSPVPPVATSIPTSPLWLLGIMAGLLSVVGIRKLRKV